MTTFLPEDFKEEPKVSNYMRFQSGENRFRILGSSITGFEYFDNENKPHRSKEVFESTPNIKKGGTVKSFWAFPIFNYQNSTIQILELTQQTIKDPILALIKNPKWGNIFLYDLNVIKSGEGLETEYQVQPEPPIGEPSDEIKAAFMEKPLNLDALFLSEDPFKAPK